MTDATIDVVGIGNALVDVLSFEDDAFIVRHDLVRDSALMVDRARSNAVYSDLGPATEMSGGSAANTIAGVASFGGTTGYIGRIRDDQLGRVFAHDLRSLGVRFDGDLAPDGTPTGRCLVIVTEDAGRTMCTYLGAAAELGPQDVDEGLVRDAAIVYVEGYLWDQPSAKEAIRHAMQVARDAGRRVAMTLSDPFCVERHRDEFRALAAGHVDVLFANEEEIISLYEVDEFDEALQRVRADCGYAALTRGAAGSVLVAGEEVHVIDAAPVDYVVDTTGAGDLYAAGVLFGVARDLPLRVAGDLGSLAAAEVISHLGPRPQVSLDELARPTLP